MQNNILKKISKQIEEIDKSIGEARAKKAQLGCCVATLMIDGHICRLNAHREFLVRQQTKMMRLIPSPMVDSVQFKQRPGEKFHIAVDTAEGKDYVVWSLFGCDGNKTRLIKMTQLNVSATP
jgi:hypothetical protein